MRRPAPSDETAVWPSGGDRHERLAAVLDRFMCELEATGLPPDVERLAAQHPDLADELRSYAESLQLLHHMTSGMRPPADAEPSAEAPPAAKRLGDYEIIREVGRGGMGVVYEAQQLSLNRPVALKVLPFAAMLDQKQIARFRTEAQAAAQLHHPNIVPVYAVGQERGVHYFAMQYIAGQSLETAIAELRGAGGGAAAPPQNRFRRDEQRMSAQRDRETVESAFSTRASTRSGAYCRSVARLMLQAAEALHHAHQLGVVHRDVKPSNLLIDRDGKLWVTDFGLARIQTDSGVTVSGDIVGTVRYMSPEQAAGKAALVDARTDVYSLGATLYELLTLTPAHHGENRQEMLKQIEESEPLAPRLLNPAVPFDLETITLRALAKGRDERYETAQELAADLRRFLAGEPTLARRPTAVDRAVKWALRHRRSVAVAAALLVLLTGVSATSAVLVVRAQRQTELSRARAQAMFEQARQAVDEFGGRFSSGLAGIAGAERLHAQVLARSLEYYQSFIAQAENDRQLEADVASAYHKAAAMTKVLGDGAEAIRLCREAIALLEQHAADPAAEDLAVSQSQLGGLYSSLGLLLADQGDASAALQAYARAIALERQAAERQAGVGEAERGLAETYSSLGLLQGQLGDKDRALRSLGACIGVLDGLAAQQPGNASLQRDLALAYNNLSFVERGADWERAEQACRRALELLKPLVQEHDEAALRSDLALSYNNFGAIESHRGRWPTACESYEQAIDLQRGLARHSPAVASHRRDLAVSLNNLGQARRQLDDTRGAVAAFDEARQIVDQLASDNPSELNFRSLLAAVENNRAMILEESGELDAALAGYERAIAQQRAVHERSPEAADVREFLSKHLFNYGRALRAAGRPAEALAAARERRQLWPGHGQRLGQVAVELAEAAAQLRREPLRDDRLVLAAEAEAEVVETLRQAAAHGCPLATLKDVKALAFLQQDGVWDKLNDASRTTTPLEAIEESDHGS
ncbi:MAG: serine/threonine protein kinase [Pirellulales bacterium]|nr:serine/threonine protein kinase [Pirellulales bacterium]